MSSQEGHLPIVEYLLQGKADVNQATKDGAPPLAFAIYVNQTEIAKLLLRNGANIESTKVFLKNYGFLDHIDILDKLCQEMKE